VNPSELFIRRRFATVLLMVAIAMFGVRAYRVLPVSDLPQVDLPTINVSASLPVPLPTMASSVASPLERSHHHRRCQFDHVVERFGEPPTSRSSSISTRHRQRHRRRADGDCAHAAAAVGLDVAAVVPQEQPR